MYNILILGNKGVGKTSYIQKFIDDKKAPKESLNCEFTFVINDKYIDVNLLESTDGDIDAAIILFDNLNSYKTLYYYNNITQHIPKVICKNKYDIDQKIMRFKDLPYFEISCKTGYNHEAPLIYLLNKLQQ